MCDSILCIFVCIGDYSVIFGSDKLSFVPAVFAIDGTHTCAVLFSLYACISVTSNPVIVFPHNKVHNFNDLRDFFINNCHIYKSAKMCQEPRVKVGEI